MIKGRNLAEARYRMILNESFLLRPDITVFLSHISEDKKAVMEIAEYIQNAGFDIYLDINDQRLQQAVANEDPQAITECIENGLNACTHMMCIVSENTVKSWWVPYEIGFGKRSKKNLSTLTLKQTVTIPAYLEITELIRGTRSLNDYLKKLGGYKTPLLEHLELNNYQKPNHPLNNYLDFYR